MKRDKNDIFHTLRMILTIWSEMPEYRLCQLIVNATQRQDPFYVEDDALIKHLKAFSELGKKWQVIQEEEILAKEASWEDEGGSVE